MCPDLPDPTNGRVTFSTDSLALFTLNTVATYSCDEGYGLSGGSTTRTCGPNAVNTDPEGTWSGSAPTCEGEYGTQDTTALHALHTVIFSLKSLPILTLQPSPVLHWVLLLMESLSHMTRLLMQWATLPLQLWPLTLALTGSS